LQYEVPRLIERVNSYFGYGAIAGVKIVQGAIKRGSNKSPLASAAAEAGTTSGLNERLAGIDDEALRSALARLGKGLKSRQP
jgi:hypothetical protein